jgi:hypothetical protein
VGGEQLVPKVNSRIEIAGVKRLAKSQRSSRSVASLHQGAALQGQSGMMCDAISVFVRPIDDLRCSFCSRLGGLR